MILTVEIITFEMNKNTPGFVLEFFGSFEKFSIISKLQKNHLGKMPKKFCMYRIEVTDNDSI